MMPERNESQKIVAMNIDKTPTIEDLVGDARTFAEEFVQGVRHANLFNLYGVQPTKTFLLNGVPGVGKTLSIKAINNTMNESVPCSEEVSVSPTDYKLLVFNYDIGRYGTAYINEGSVRVQKFFDSAGAVARYGVDTLIVADEADALFSSRKSSLQSHGEDRKVLETLMKNIQIAHDTPNMYVVLMTNLVEDLDEAAIRSGRIDRRLQFNLPKQEELGHAYQKAIDVANERASWDVIRKYNVDALAELSVGFNYADVNNIITSTINSRVRELLQTKEKGIITAGYVTQKRLVEQITRHKTERKMQQQEKRKIGF
jgi:SpoVK/Ycf46/Vps4 family AAA+-type ATPase